LNLTTPVTQANSLGLVKFSKILSKVNTHILGLGNNLRVTPRHIDWNLSSTFDSNATICLKKLKTLTMSSNTFITNTESVYTSGLFDKDIILSRRNRNLNLDLSMLYKLSLGQNYPSLFDFNLENNLQISKQQRWLVRNSLLTESITNNSFLITQAKKLIGVSLFDKNFTGKTLWVPTKSSNLSSTETSLYFNNFFKNPLTAGDNTEFLKSSNLYSTNFNNLNFFENSRFWVMKKYFFTNQQYLNILTTQPKVKTTNTYHSNHYISNIFTLNLYSLTLNTFTKNSLTPSLFINISDYSKTYTKQVLNIQQNPIHLNLSSLEVLGGTNTTFVYNITSNPQNSPNTSTYFNNLDFSLNHSNYITSGDYKNNKFFS
jgi:hypothetical protein